MASSIVRIEFLCTTGGLSLLLPDGLRERTWRRWQVGLSVLQAVEIARMGCRARPLPEKQVPYDAFPEHPPQFLEGEERDKRDKHDQTLGIEFMRTFAQQVLQGSRHTFPVEQSPHSGLAKGKERHPAGKQRTLKEGRQHQGFGLKTAPKGHETADHDHFGQ